MKELGRTIDHEGIDLIRRIEATFSTRRKPERILEKEITGDGGDLGPPYGTYYLTNTIKNDIEPLHWKNVDAHMFQMVFSYISIKAMAYYIPGLMIDAIRKQFAGWDFCILFGAPPNSQIDQSLKLYEELNSDERLCVADFVHYFITHDDYFDQEDYGFWLSGVIELSADYSATKVDVVKSFDCTPSV